MDISDLPDHPDCDPAADPDWAVGDGTYSPDVLVLDDQVSLLRTWRHLVGSRDAHRGHGLWLLLIDEDDHPMAGVLEVEHCVDLPDPDQLDSMVAMLRGVLDDAAPDGRVAMLRSRPGTHPVDAEDRRFAAGLLAACRRGGLATDLVHLATADRVVPLPPDDLPMSA